MFQAMDYENESKIMETKRVPFFAKDVHISLPEGILEVRTNTIGYHLSL
jgi:hypothetical protein